jgi:hypothetical protein
MNKPLFACSLAFSSVCGASLYKYHDWKDPATKLIAFMSGSTLLVSVLTLIGKLK